MIPWWVRWFHITFWNRNNLCFLKMASDDMRKQDDFRMSSSCMVSLIRFQIFLECFTRFYCLEWFIPHFFLSVMLSKDHEGIWSYTNSSLELKVQLWNQQCFCYVMVPGSLLHSFLSFKQLPESMPATISRGAFWSIWLPWVGLPRCCFLGQPVLLAEVMTAARLDCSRDGMQNAGCTTVPFPDNLNVHL